MRGHYTGTPSEVIEKLRQAGQDVSWYAKHKDTKLTMEAEKCGYFTVYLLDGEWSYTLTSEGDKYQQYIKLKKPEAESCYYCSACKERFYEREAALEHRLIRSLDQ